MNLPQIPQQTPTLVDLLCLRGGGAADSTVGYTFLGGDNGVDEHLSYVELDRQARHIAARLLSEGRRGERALILCAPGGAYVASLFGCLYAGVTAVTAYPPRARRKDQRLDAVINDAQATFALVDGGLHQRKAMLCRWTESLEHLVWLDADALRSDPDVSTWSRPEIAADDLAVLQYTSGSTASPRGVQLTHRNLMHNLAVIRDMFAYSPTEDTLVTWLPPYHDMGLIGGLLEPMFGGLTAFVMPPAAFIQQPLRWLQAISDYRASTSGAPNFAYDLCVEKISDEQARKLDLHSWKLAFNGAEPILPETLKRFADKFAPSGFRAEAFLPCYGLAEATLMVSGGRRAAPPRTKIFAGDREIVSCGTISPLHTVRIVDVETGLVCAEGEEGEIWISSDSVSSGYWQQPEATEATFGGRLADDPRRYLRSGDLGRMSEGHLYVTGRLKDLIVLRGRNLHPHELEAAIDRCHPQSIVHGSAAFTIQRASDQTLALAMVHEVKRRTQKEDYEAIVTAIRRQIAAEFDVQVEAVQLLRSGALPRTSSGKPRRREARAMFDSGELSALYIWPGDAHQTGASAPVKDAAAGYNATVPGQLAASAGHNAPAPGQLATPVGEVHAMSEAEIQRWLAERIARQVSMPVSRIDIHAPFAEFGLDSVSAVMIAGELEEHVARRLPATLFYDAPNIAAVARLVAPPEPQPARQPESSDAADNHGQQIAIVGVACRLPGCASPAEFWQLIRSGRNTICEPPPARAEAISDNATTRRGGWLQNVDSFDAALFGIAPTEASWVDPQHRLLLETCWQAIENAGCDPKGLSGSNVGVFVGISNDDYAKAILAAGLPARAYSVTGNAASMAAHRISYHFDLHGPSLSLDTACSSSLVAVHQARRSLQAGDCDAALVAGVNLIIRPEVTAALSESGMLAADGLCRSFDAGANGYVRGEGCVAILLKRVADAQRDGDPILAVIAGSAINQDGRTNGITAPNGAAQQRLMQAALRDAQLHPSAVTLVEAHGTGTVLGDPIEFQALREVYDAPREADEPCCVIGSAKANIGHLESAAGLASLLKAVLAIQHAELPPLANFTTVNPHISLTGSRFRLPTQAAPWQSPRRIAAVSSFGFGGTNAHVLLSQPIRPAASDASRTAPSERSQLVALSGHSEAAARELAASIGRSIAELDEPLADIAATANASRTALAHRVAVIGQDRHAIAAGLQAYALGQSAADLYTGVATPTGSPKLAFLFSGQGGQYVGMGRGLYAASPTFRLWVDRCETLLQDTFADGVKSFLLGQPCDCGRCSEAVCENGKRLRLPCSQTALFVLQVGLAEVLKQAGVLPNVVLGHSLGEYAAACIAGVMQPEQGLRLTAVRAHAIAGLQRQGAMAIVFAHPDVVQAMIAATDVSIAAINGPAQMVLSGESSAMEAVLARLSAHGVNHRPLPTATAFHSSLMDPILDRIKQAIESFSLKNPSLDFVSTVTGDGVSSELRSAEYWLQHTRQSVQFAAALQSLHDRHCGLLVELGPHPTLCALAAMNPGSSGTLIATLQRNVDDSLALQRTLAQLYVAGVEIDWRAIAPTIHGPAQRRALLPTYPFQRRRYWLDGIAAAAPPSNLEEASLTAVDNSRPLPPAELLELQAYTALFPHIDCLVAETFRDCLVKLGWRPQLGERTTVEQLANQLHVVPGYRKMLRRMLEVLGEDGQLEPLAAPSASQGWTVKRLLDRSETTAAQWAERILQINPSVGLEIRMALRCGAGLGDVLQGAVEPLTILMPEGRFDELETLYGRSPIARRANQVVADQIVQLARHSDKPLRILEIGAGTGGTTAGVLQRLRDEGIDYAYHFTDNSPLFGHVAAEKFANDFPAIQYGVLDIERSPQEQNWQPGRFDLVLAANVLHATQSLRTSLRNVQQLLVPGGALVLLESTQRRRLLDLIFGMTPGWWRFEDTDLRATHPLLHTDQWEHLLSAEGFVAPTTTAAYHGEALPTACQSVIVASVPRRESLSEEIAGAAFTGAAVPSAGATSATFHGATVNSATDTSPAQQLREASAEQRPVLLEQFLSERLAAILGMDLRELDVEQPVNNLGVDSLMAIQLKNRVESELELQIPMVAFLQGHSVRQLMRKMLEQINATDNSPATTDVPLVGESSARVIRSTASELLPEIRLQLEPAPQVQTTADGCQILGPLSVGQQALWTIHQMAPHSAAYNFAFIARATPGADIRGGTVRLDAKRLQRACDRLQELHPELSTRYRLRGAQPERVWAPAQKLLVIEHDCTGWSQEQLIGWIREQSDKPFDLHNGPVVRFLLLRHEDGDLISIMLHHIAADLWSMDMLIQQLCRLYVHPHSLTRPDGAVDYSDYVRWEQGLEHSEEGERLWTFWREKLRDAPPVLQLPISHPRPAQQTYNGDSHAWRLSPEVTQSLRALSAREKTTLFTTMLAGYQGFLSRICGQDDLLVGTVVANRARSEWEQVAGYFLNQLVLRTRLSESTTFRDLLTQTRSEMLQALEHQAIPFAQLVNRLGVARDPSRAPLVQTMFIWDKPRHLRDSQFGDDDQDYPTIRLQPLLMEQRGAAFDLTLIVFELEDRLSLVFRYNTDLFDAAAVESLADGFTACLTSLVRQPDQPIAEAPLLSRKAYQRQIVQWNDTYEGYEATTSLHLFEQQVLARPDAPAIITTSASHSYAELNDHAERIAGKLTAAGVGVGDIVGISLPRGPQTIASILAAWKVNAAYLPLDPDYPDARLQYMVSDAQPAAILTHDEERFSVLGISPDVDCDGTITASSQSHPVEQTDHPAYMIYTSGSTGRPKGALLRHRGLCNLTVAQRRCYAAGAGDRVLQFASLNFDASIFEIVLALNTGAALCIPDLRSGQPTSRLVIEQMRQLKVTIATLPPSILATQAGDDLPHLRIVISAGEACTPQCIQNWARNRDFYNAYGPTEATVWATIFKTSSEATVPPIGRPIANCKAYVLDRNLQPLPVGVPGELCLAGPGLAIGYHGQAELTAEKFVPNPFSSDDDATLYRTGDLVRYRNDGEIEFLGRIDNQVKISGHRIEPDEIAAAIGQMERVRNAVVLPQPVKTSLGATQRLVAYYVPDAMPGPNISEMRAAARARLPEFMVPSHWIPVPEFPLTANGKVDFAALPAVSENRPELRVHYAAPTTATERKLAAIWAEVLLMERVGIRDNFFDLGGASLQAVQAADQASRAGLTLAPERMFQYQTIEQLAGAIDEAAAAERETDAASVSAYGGDFERAGGLSHSSAGPRAAQASDGSEPWFAQDLAVCSVPQTAAAIADPTHADAAQPDAAQPDAVVGDEAALRPSENAARRLPLSTARMVVESLGVYLPAARWTTEEVVRGCTNRLDFPLERMSGIVARQVAGDQEFSLDLAIAAARNCFRHSRFCPSDIDVLVACNISRYDGPNYQVSYEPTTAAKLAAALGMPGAWTFDICNACAGFFTAMEVVRCMLANGTIRRAMIVSGEYISHLSKTAQLEIDGFLDPRLACLTLGDAGAATIVELSDSGAGFEALDMYTAGKHHDLCVAKISDRPHGGAIMMTDAVRASAVTLKHSISHAHRVLEQHKWDPAQIDKLIMHQTSTTTLDGAVEELNRSYGRTVCDRNMAVYNVMQRGNTASTTHWLAVMDQIRSGQLNTGDRAAFAISGSGQTVGTALYRFDDLPDRMRLPVTEERTAPKDAGVVTLGFAAPTVELIAAAIIPPNEGPDAAPQVVDMAAAAATAVIQSVSWDRADIELLLHAGIYRNEYLSEPAVAAILAGKLKINDDLPTADGRRTLAFDVLDGGRGALTACLLASQMMQAGNLEKALITSSEVENNREVGVAARRGLAEMGSALLLQQTRRGAGLGASRMRRFDQYQHLIETHTAFEDGRTVLKIHQHPDAQRRLIECIGKTVEEFLSAETLPLEKIAAVFPPNVSADFAAALADTLQIPLSRFILPSNYNLDAFTSSLALQWQHLQDHGMPARGEWGLIIGVGAGVEVGCTLYHF